MDRFTKSDLQEILDYTPGPCVSIYLPTIRATDQVQQNPIRFKNLVKQAKDHLIENGMRRPEAEALLGPAHDQLPQDGDFWQNQSDGLAIFAAPGLFRAYRVPVDFEETVQVGDHFYFKPLFSLFLDQGRFYILALSQGDVRLLEGRKYRVDSVDLEQVPTSLVEALKWDDPEKQMQGHSISRGGGAGLQGQSPGRPDVAFHGHREDLDDDTRILRFFQKLDKGLNELIGERRIPIVLAGVEYLFPIYRKASTSSALLDEGIPGNPEEIKDEELHARAWELVQPIFRREANEALDLFLREKGRQTGKASSEISEVIQAARGGRVSQLLVADGCEVWGTYDRLTNQVETHAERKPESEELTNTAAMYAYLNGGSVYLLEPRNMPESACVAAVFRY